MTELDRDGTLGFCARLFFLSPGLADVCNGGQVWDGSEVGLVSIELSVPSRITTFIMLPREKCLQGDN